MDRTLTPSRTSGRDDGWREAPGGLRRSGRRGAFAALVAVSLALSATVGQGAPIEAGDEGTARFPDLERLTTLTTPEIGITGVYAVFKVTHEICMKVATVEDDLAALAPEGFKIARGDVHSLGFEAPVFNDNFWAISVTGDSEKDEAGGHPYWSVKYGEDGKALRCSMKWSFDPATLSEDERRHIGLWLFIGVPQLFKGLLTKPRFAGLYRPIAPDYMEMVASCPAGWCDVTVNPLLFGDEWLIAIDFALQPPPR